jgi:DNA-binding beta-propeller fold protein YncE
VSGFGRLVARADGAGVYLPTNAGTFVVINSEGAITGTADMPGGIIDVLVGPGDGRVYLLTWTAERPQLIAVDAVTAATLGPAVRIRGGAPDGLLLSPDGTKIYSTQAVMLSFLTTLFMTRVTVLDTAAV